MIKATDTSAFSWKILQHLVLCSVQDHITQFLPSIFLLPTRDLEYFSKRTSSDFFADHRVAHFNAVQLPFEWRGRPTRPQPIQPTAHDHLISASARSSLQGLGPFLKYRPRYRLLKGIRLTISFQFSAGRGGVLLKD